MPARTGRGDVLELVERRGLATDFRCVLRLIAACARHDAVAVAEIAEREPLLQAGASVSGVSFPSGYAAVDDLDRSRRRPEPA